MCVFIVRHLDNFFASCETHIASNFIETKNKVQNQVERVRIQVYRLGARQAALPKVTDENDTFPGTLQNR